MDTNTKRPLLLDLFCGAGGAAVGYHRAGFDVLGVDIAPQKRYPFSFIQADALEMLTWLIQSGDIRQFAAIHASPPCQGYGQTRFVVSSRGREYPLLLGETRARLIAAGVPWVLENVPGAPMLNPLEICGTALGLRVRRHRLFDCSLAIFAPGPCRHGGDDLGIYAAKVTRLGTRGTAYSASSGRTHYRPLTAPMADGKAAMGIDWMDRHELSEAIPPAYTEWIGTQLLAALANTTTAA